MKKPRLKFLDASSTQTLREGIQELRDAETADSDASESFPPELIADIDIHDAIHVLFGCPASLRGETIAHVWTAFGTSTKMSDMHRVNEHQDHKMVLSQIGHIKLLKTWLSVSAETYGDDLSCLQDDEEVVCREHPFISGSFLSRTPNRIRHQTGSCSKSNR